MEREKRYTLRLLDIIEQNSQVSQRELSKKLGISLGLVNFLIRGLVRGGYFEVVNLPSRRLAYILTPKGIAEKSRLVTEYLDYSLRFYREVRKAIQEKLDELENEQIREIIFYGIGDMAELVYLCLHQSSIDLVGVVDKEKKGGTFFGHKIHAPDDLLKLPRVAIFITTLEDNDEKVKEIRENGGFDRMIFDLTSVDQH